MNTPEPVPVAAVTLLEWRPLGKGSLVGFVTVQIGRSLIVRDVSVLTSNGRCWAGLPGKPVIGRDGLPVKGNDGKQKYVPVLEWNNRAASDRFSESVILAIRAQFPGALDDAA